MKHVLCVDNANISCLGGDRQWTGLKVLVHTICTAVISHFKFTELTEHFIVGSLSKILPHFRRLLARQGFAPVACSPGESSILWPKQLSNFIVSNMLTGFMQIVIFSKSVMSITLASSPSSISNTLCLQMTAFWFYLHLTQHPNFLEIRVACVCLADQKQTLSQHWLTNGDPWLAR